jgi:hypothetical protein
MVPKGDSSMTTIPLDHAVPTAPADSVRPEPGPVREVWWLACHGGAGTSTLAFLTGIGIDCGQHSPVSDFSAHPEVGVVLVYRASAWGAFSAEHTLGTLARLACPPRLLGTVVVGAEERRPARAVRERIDLVGANVPAQWQVPFIRELLAASNPAQVGLHPAVADLAARLRQLVPAMGPDAADGV